MSIHPYVNKLLTLGYRILPGGDDECPACDYRGRFSPVVQPTGWRRHAKCPACGALERHRLQHIVIERTMAQLPHRPSILHIAPEPALTEYIQSFAGRYDSGDIKPGRAALTLDLRSMDAIADETYDLVYASHVLEHVDQDARALSEIRRVIKPGGCAILPVPIVVDSTVEYPEPSPTEHFHVRATGPDYFERYESEFGRVDYIRSSDAPDAAQTWTYEKRSGFPNRNAPNRPSQDGDRHEDVVPVCWR